MALRQSLKRHQHGQVGGVEVGIEGRRAEKLGAAAQVAADEPGTFGVNTLVPFAQRSAVGGAEFLAAHVARLNSQNPLNVVVGAGDFIGASPLISALFFDEPAVETLNHVGVEFNAVGNHEFDKGKEELKRLQNGGCKITNGNPDPNSCKGLGSRAHGTFDGAAFKWLSANVIEPATGDRSCRLTASRPSPASRSRSSA